MSGTRPLSSGHGLLRLDCRFFRGDRPCAAGMQGACAGECARYSAMGTRIVIVKLAALGDVIRTAALLPGLKARWPQSHVTWVTRPAGVRMLSHHPLIERLLPYDAETLCQLEHERFDLCLSLDKEPGATALAMRLDARDRRGLGLSPFGTVYPLNPECEPYFLLGLSDEAKFRRNQKSYPQLIYEAVGLEYSGQAYRVYPGRPEQERAAARWAALGVGAGETVIGLNTGAGSVFANKNWPADRFAALAERLLRRGWRVALLGGPAERERNRALAAACPGLVDSGTDHDELTFAALVARCHAVVTGDTLALHVAVALRVPVVALFGPTCAQEIDLFGRGAKIVSALPCGPCYLRHCTKAPNCMDHIPVAEVERAVLQALHAGRTAPRAGAAVQA